MVSKNSFKGADALRDYLNPTNGEFSPLIELPESLNPFAKYNVHLHAKMLSALPLGNVKSLPAYAMLANRKPDGKTKIIESSSGNTVASLGVLAPYFGFKEVNAFVSHETTRGKLKMLKLFGVKLIVNREPICPSEHDLTSGIHKARQKGQDAEWYNPGQYDNPDNIAAHYQVTGPQIWQQTEGQIDYFCAGLGTTGTMIGTAQYLKEQSPAIQMVGVVRSPNNPVPGPRTRNLLDDISFEWQKSCDALVDVGTFVSYELSLKMIRAGLMAGPSSGLNLAGVYKFIQKKIDEGDFVEGQHDVHVVFPCCDTPFPYMDEYFKVLSADHFPRVENAHLLQFADHSKAAAPLSDSAVTAQELYQLIRTEDPVNRVIDLRNAEQFSHYHIPGSINIPENDFITHVNSFAELYKHDVLYFVCDFGGRSFEVCRYAQAKNLTAVNLEGGLTAWSEQNLPRVRDEKCVLRYQLA